MGVARLSRGRRARGGGARVESLREVRGARAGDGDRWKVQQTRAEVGGDGSSVAKASRSGGSSER